MKKDKRNRFRDRFSQTISKFFNIFTYCSRQSTSCVVKNPSYSNAFTLSTPVITQSNLYLSQIRKDHNHRKSSFYSTNFISIDEKNLSHYSMPQIALIDSEFCIHNDGVICHVTRQEEPIFSSSLSSSSSSTSNCQSSLTIHQCYSTNIISSGILTDIEMLNNTNNNTHIIEKSSSPPPPISSGCSYLIRPSTPCIFGRENYNDEHIDDDEFFLTAGGIIHSCPNIYELSIDNDRKLQSCQHLMFIDQQTTLISNNNLNCYDIEFDRYSILPRFQPNSLSVSTDSINSDLELYKERHAIGLSRQYHDNMSPYSSFLPTTWKSDNYLLLIPFIHHHSSFLNSIVHGKRSRSHNIKSEQTHYSSTII